MQYVTMDDSQMATPLASSADDVEFTEAISSSRMVSSLLRNHDRNFEVVRNFNRWEQSRSVDSVGDPVVSILDSIHVETEEPGSDSSPVTPRRDLSAMIHANGSRNCTYREVVDDGKGHASRMTSSGCSTNREPSAPFTQSDRESPFSSDIEVSSGLLCRKGTLSKLFRNRGRNVQRARDQMVKRSSDANELINPCYTQQKPSIKTQYCTVDPSTSIEALRRIRLANAKDEGKERRREHSSKGRKDKSSATPDDSTRSPIESLFSKIKRAVDYDLSHEIQPPLVHSFTNKMFAMRTPWQLPMKERSLRNNVQQIISFFRVLERYVEDQVFRYGPAVHPRLETVYNEIYSKIDQLFKRVSEKHIAHLAERRRLAVVGNGLYDLGDHRSRGAPIYYQKFVLFDLSQDGSSLASEHGDVFHYQVLHFPMNSRGLPSMQYLCSVASAVLFWLDFYNRDNVVIFNYSALNYNMLLTFACAIVASEPLSTANEIDQLITNSFDWRRKCQTVTTKGNKVKHDPTHNNELPLMIPIARWPPSYKRYMSYFLSLYATPIDFVLAQQFKLKTITLVNCMIPGTEVMVEVYKIGPEAAQSNVQGESGSHKPSTECSRYSAVFYPKCACGGKERDGVMLVACPADYKMISMSTSSKSGKYGYVGEVVFDFTTDAMGNKRDIIVSGDIAIAIVALARKERRVIATYSFNTGFVNSEILEIPRAEFDIWDTSCAIQAQGQMTVSMESRQRHSYEMWNNTAPSPVVITPPTSDVGVFMRYHVAKVADTDIQALMHATNLSYETCIFALKLCPKYYDAIAILNALFVSTKTKTELENAVLRTSKSSPRDIPTVASIDVPRPMYDIKSDVAPIGYKSIDSDLHSGESSVRTNLSGSSDLSGGSKTALNLEQVEKLVMDPDSTMHVLLTDGTKIPVPNNTLGSLFQMFGSAQAPPKAAVSEVAQPEVKDIDGIPVEPSFKAAAEPHVSKVVPKIPPKAFVPSEPVKSVPSKATPPMAKGGAVPTTPKPPPVEMPPKSSLTPKSAVSKAPPACVKKGPPCKMKAPPPPPLKAKAASSRVPPPLGVKLHWRPLNTNSVKGTIFENLPKPSTTNKMFDSSVAKQLFSKAAVKRLNTMKAPEVKRKLGEEIFDSKRAQNVAIILRFPKDSDLDELIECLDTLTLENPIINLENVGKILSSLPQGSEVESFKLAMQNGTDTTTYRDVEQKVLKIVSRQQMDSKARVANFALNYKSLLEGINEQLNVFESANQQIANSEFLPIVMGVILQYGNFVNHGEDSDHQILGFSLSSASKLIDMKSADNTLSSMHYLVVNMIVKFPDYDFTTFDKSLNRVIEAEKINALGIDEVFDEIREGLNFLIRLEGQVDHESILYSKTKELISESTEAVGAATERQKQVFEDIKNTWRYLGEECRQGIPLEDIFKILGDFMRCIKKVVHDIQQRPSKFIVAINDEGERQIYTSKFVRSRRR